jgi:hypothetical protein
MLANVDIADASLSPEPMPKTPGGICGRLELPPDFPELRLFAMLLWKFRRPNGPLSLVCGGPDGDPDAPFKWDFLFVPHGELRLQVIRNGAGIELMWWGESAEPVDLIAFLESNIDRHDKEIAATIKQLEQYTLILNPYVRHRNIAAFALAELDKIILREPVPLRGIKTQDEVAGYSEEQKTYMELAERQASLMLLLVTESAFMAESFLNLLIALLVRPDVRASKAAMEETLMRRWKSKIERLNIDCLGIPKPADPGDARLGAAKKLFDTRNRVAHSYPDKVQMAVGKMWFHKSFPVLEKGEPFSKFVIALSNQLPSLAEARFCNKAADDLVEFLIALVDPTIRDEIQYATSRNPIGYNETKGLYGVPFGDFVVLAVTRRSE